MTTFTRQPMDVGAGNTLGSAPVNETVGDDQWVIFSKYEAQLDELKTVFGELYALLGIAEGSTDMGAYALGTTITDLASIKSALDEIDAAMGAITVLPAGYTPLNTGVPMVGDQFDTAIAKLHFLVTLLDESRRAAGSWDASTGAFPTTGLAPSTVAGQTIVAGFLYDVTVAGTVDSIPFAIGDRVLALTDGVSATYAGHWLRLPRAVELTTNTPVQATDGTGALGVESLASRGDHRHPLDIIPTPVNANGTAAFGTREMIDASGALVARTLPAATGAGGVIEFMLGPKGNGATVQPQAGDQINGVVDHVEPLAAGYTLWRAVDGAPGEWLVSSGGGGLANGGTLAADPAPALPETHYGSAYAGAFTLPALSTVADGARIELTNSDGQLVQVTADAADGGAVLFNSDSIGQRVYARVVSGAWTVAPNLVLAGSVPQHAGIRGRVGNANRPTLAGHAVAEFTPTPEFDDGTSLVAATAGYLFRCDSDGILQADYYGRKDSTGHLHHQWQVGPSESGPWTDLPAGISGGVAIDLYEGDSTTDTDSYSVQWRVSAGDYIRPTWRTSGQITYYCDSLKMRLVPDQVTYQAGTLIVEPLSVYQNTLNYTPGGVQNTGQATPTIYANATRLGLGAGSTTISDGVSVAANILTVERAGRYEVSWDCTIEDNAGSSTRFGTFIGLNGVDLHSVADSLVSGFAVTINNRVVVDLAANDQLDFRMLAFSATENGDVIGFSISLTPVSAHKATRPEDVSATGLMRRVVQLDITPAIANAVNENLSALLPGGEWQDGDEALVATEIGTLRAYNRGGAGDADRDTLSHAGVTREYTIHFDAGGIIRTTGAGQGTANRVVVYRADT